MRTIFVLLGLLAASVTVEGTDIDLDPTETSRCSFIYQTKANQSIR